MLPLSLRLLKYIKIPASTMIRTVPTAAKIHNHLLSEFSHRRQFTNDSAMNLKELEKKYNRAN